jgi:hypothetical protein
MKKIIYLVFAALCALQGSAQTKPRNSIGLTVGWQNFTVLDKHVSPLRYSTNSLFPKLGLFYNKETNRSILDVQVSASKGTIHPSRFGERRYKAVWSAKDSFQYSLGSKFIHANIEASYLRNVSSLSTDKFNYWVGGTLKEAAYYGDEVASSDWLLNVADLAPSFQIGYLPLNNHKLTIRVDLSVLGVITRPIYALFPKSNKDKNLPSYFKQGTQLASLDKFQKVNFQVGYQYQVGRHFAAGVLYRLKWLHYSLPADVRAVDKQFDIKLSYTY